jgi:hypothetical protein
MLRALRLLIALALLIYCFNPIQYSYPLTLLRVISSNAILKMQNGKKELPKGQLLWGGGHDKNEFGALLVIKRGQNGEALPLTRWRRYEGTISRSSISESPIIGEFYSKAVEPREVAVAWNDGGDIMINQKAYTSGACFPIVRKEVQAKSTKIVFALPDGSTHAATLPDKHFYTEELNWNTDENLPTIQQPWPNIVIRFIHSTLITSGTAFCMLLLLLYTVWGTFTYAFQEKNRYFSPLFKFLIVFFFLSLFSSCSYDVLTTGIYEHKLGWVSFGKGSLGFFSLFYDPAILFLTALLIISLVKSFLLLTFKMSLATITKPLKRSGEGAKTMGKRNELVPPDSIEDERGLQKAEHDLDLLKHDTLAMEKYFSGLFGGIKAEVYRRNRERLAKVVGADVRLLDAIYNKREILGKLRTQKTKLELEIRDLEGDLKTKDIEKELKKERLLDELEAVQDRRTRRKTTKEREDYDI